MKLNRKSKPPGASAPSPQRSLDPLDWLNDEFEKLKQKLCPEVDDEESNTLLKCTFLAGIGTACGQIAGNVALPMSRTAQAEFERLTGNPVPAPGAPARVGPPSTPIEIR